jgi:hypothetical protein
MDTSREQVIAYRVAAQQLDRSARSVADLEVLDIGVQEAMGQPAGYAFDARLPTTPPPDLVGPGKQLALVWSLRGAPHVHRRADLDAVTAALYPLSEADATGRLNETGPSIERAGIPAMDQLATAVQAMREAVRTPTAKGAASAAVTKAIPKPMRRDCRACRTSHISDSAMRASSLPAGLELQPGTAPPVLQRRKGARVVRAVDLEALTRLIRAYLRLLGPATAVDVAGYLGARRADVQPAWPDDLVEIRVGRASAWLPPDCIAAFDAAPAPELVRLLGGFDPYLQARDRDLVVPDPAVQKALWPVLGRPGAVFVDGEVVGRWRPKATSTALTVAVEAFAPLPPPVWGAIGDEAERIAAVRGLRLRAVDRTG